jgi:hypothetical protein
MTFDALAILIDLVVLNLFVRSGTEVAPPYAQFCHAPIQ